MPELKERGVISFPKCGRTWIRLFLEYYRRFTHLGGRAVVICRHDTDKGDFKKRVLLIRHPCDVMVSYYLHKKIRRRRGGRSIRSFIRSQRVGIPFFNKQYREWSKRKDNQLVVRYEDMFDAQIWIDMLEFFDIPLFMEAFNEAIEKTKFANVRSNLEEISKFPSAWRYLAAEDGNYNLLEPKSPEAHKFRRGKVGGYVDYLNEDDIEYILDNFTLGENLEPYRQQYLEMSCNLRK